MPLTVAWRTFATQASNLPGAQPISRTRMPGRTCLLRSRCISHTPTFSRDGKRHLGSLDQTAFQCDVVVLASDVDMNYSHELRIDAFCTGLTWANTHRLGLSHQVLVIFVLFLVSVSHCPACRGGFCGFW